jgi:hypothetical protein
MNTDQIESLVSNLNCKVVSLDQLPQVKTEGDEMFIINTENINSNAVGHWLLISKKIINGKTRINYFDALGLPPVLRQTIIYINENICGGNFVANLSQIQSSESSSCGKFAVLLASHLNNNLSYESFLHVFRFTPEINEKRVAEAFAMYKRNFEQHRPPARH